MVFPGVQKTTWTYDREAKAWYFHRFYDFQPDLNTSNPEVQDEILKIMGFWIQSGVSGFRMDAVPSLSPPRDQTCESQRSSSICCACFANSCSGGRAAALSSPQPMCCPPTPRSILGGTA